MCAQRLAHDVPTDPAQAATRITAFLDAMRTEPVAVLPALANAQHYEVPAALFEQVLGPHLKYSCGYWSASTTTLADAEAQALALTCEHAALRDGQTILELGCGWGSLTLWMAEHYPRSQITAVSNSASQRAFIEARAEARGLRNIEIITADVGTLELDEAYDRIVSIEMFEHMRNWPRLLARVAQWLAPGGQVLIHVFCHRSVPYTYETEGSDNWMGRNFFSGGIMPSDDLMLRSTEALVVRQQWRWPGTHYQRTANAWLANLDRRRSRIEPILGQTHGSESAALWTVRWRLFFMACAELFGYRGGREWWVSHYRLHHR